jgi:hypothetical protein
VAVAAEAKVVVAAKAVSPIDRFDGLLPAFSVSHG